MNINVKYCFAVLLLSIGLAGSAYADTISAVKLPLGLGSGFTDVVFDGTTFGTRDDGNAATLGDQNTSIIFTGFGGLFTDIVTATASFSLDDVAIDGSPLVTGNTVAQNMSGGSFSLWDPSNELLLSGTLNDGLLSGGINGISTGSYFNTQLGSFTGGSLATFLVPNSANLSLALNSIVSGIYTGMHVNENGSLDAFTSDASALIEGRDNAVPEPATALLFFSGLAGLLIKRKLA